MLATAWPFIEIDDRGRPLIQGTRIKVLLLIQQCLAWSWNAEQVRANYPQLTLAQIHAALGYYYEHQAECDGMIADDQQQIEELRRESEDADWQRKMRELKAKR